jgi:hypothetical protein
VCFRGSSSSGPPPPPRKKNVVGDPDRAETGLEAALRVDEDMRHPALGLNGDLRRHVRPSTGMTPAGLAGSARAKGRDAGDLPDLPGDLDRARSRPEPQGA